MKNDCSTVVLAMGGQLHIPDLCSRIAELLWVFLWPGLRSSFDTEMAGDGIVRWRPRCESGIILALMKQITKWSLTQRSQDFAQAVFALYILSA